MALIAKMLNREAVTARLAKLPSALKEAVNKQLRTEVDDLTAAIKRAAPVGGPGDDKPGALRDSVHAYENPKRDLSYRVIADARDEHGHMIGKHVEFGHLARDGSHVAARPFFFPTYRARKKPMRRRLSAAATKALKKLYPK